jgi:hypothetical protein
LLLQPHSWNIQIQWCIVTSGYFGEYYFWFRSTLKRIAHYLFQKCHYSSSQSSNMPSFPWTLDEMLDAFLGKRSFPRVVLAWWTH